MGYLWKIFKLLPFLHNSSQPDSKKSLEIRCYITIFEKNIIQ